MAYKTRDSFYQNILNPKIPGLQNFHIMSPHYFKMIDFFGFIIY